MTTQKFAVSGMHCASCGILIDEALESVRGVLSAKTSVRKGITVVEFDPDVASLKAMIKAVRKAGYLATPS